MLRSASLILLIAAASVAQAQDASPQGKAWRWTDAAGIVHYSDLPPPPGARDVREMRPGQNFVETGELPYATRRAAQDYPVILFTTPDCATACKEARDFLARRGIPYSESAITSPEDGERFKKVFGSGDVFVPSVTVGNQKARGFEQGNWTRLLDLAGYAAAPLRPTR